MTAQELMTPRFEVIANYPKMMYSLNQILYCTSEYQSSFFSEFPHLFKKLNWWEYRTKEEMPKKLICKAIANDTDIMLIEEWDMVRLFGFTDISKKEGCSLYSFSPEFGYFPID